MQSSVKVVIVLLSVVIIALIIGVFYIWDKSQRDLDKTVAKTNEQQMEIDALNAQLKARKDELKEKEETEAALKSQLQQAAQQQQALREQLAKSTNELLAASSKLRQTARSVETLTSQNTQLKETISKLNTDLASLNDRIKTLEDELIRGEKQRELVLKELAAVRLGKANLEKRINDIGEIRGQYKKLRHDEILEDRRRWIAQGYDGFYTKTGVFEPAKPYVSKASEYDLKAEIRLTPDTNRPPHSISDKPGGLQ